MQYQLLCTCGIMYQGTWYYTYYDIIPASWQDTDHIILLLLLCCTIYLVRT